MTPVETLLTFMSDIIAERKCQKRKCIMQ
jgi:hypothetical protein